ncbi:hypothetical protein MMC18_005839 [Xylographa bjoerkii]|nr:hypothetical protein [Xylographa bjoerkii]
MTSKLPRTGFFQRPILYQLYTFWLFAVSDLKFIVGPSSAFGIANALAVSVYGDYPQPTLQEVAPRILLVVFWAWINLLPCCIDNQRQENAIEEDGLNKAWRPLPSQRLNSKEARRLMLAIYPLAVVVSVFLGGFKQSLTLIFLGYLYNDCGGADSNFLIRNFLNACAFVCFLSGTMEVALNSTIPMRLDSTLVLWFLIIGLIIFSTIQLQDMYDQEGDKARGRQTAPLVIGDELARWTIAGPMSFLCLFCPWYWDSSLSAYTLSGTLGGTVIYRTLKKRGVIDDKRTSFVWNIWLVSTYLLPLIGLYGF